MSAVYLGLWFLAAFGFAYVVGYSRILFGLRIAIGGTDAVDPPLPPVFPYVGPWIATLMECPACLGFWLGLGAWYWQGVLMLPPFPGFAGAVVLAFATSASNLILALKLEPSS